MVKIFVGNLSMDVTSRELRELFEQYGEIDDCEKVDGKPFGFVHMDSDVSANMAVQNLHRINFKGSKINVEISANKPQKLFVGNLSPRTTSEELRELFESAGAKVIQAETCEGKKFGFVRVEASRGFRELHQLVRKLHGSMFKGNSLVVEHSEDKTVEEKRRLKEEKELGYHSHRGRGGHGHGYQPYHTPYSVGNQGWDSGNHFDDFPVDNWSPGPQRGHANKMRGFGKGGGFPGPGFVRDFDSQLGGGYGYAVGYDNHGGAVGQGAAGGQASAGPDAAELLQSKFKGQMFTQTSATNLKLLETGQFSDYQVNCEGTIFQVHRSIVATKSPVFMRIMTNSAGPAVVRDVDSHTMRMLLQFIYTGKVDVVDINPAGIMKLLTAAELYQVEMVKEGLEASLVENISMDTAVDYLIVSEELQLMEMKSVVKEFICSRAKIMKERKDFRAKLGQYPHLTLELFDAAATSH